MRNLMFAVAVVVVCHQTAAAYWPTTDITREKAKRDKLPLTVAVTALGDGTLEVKYEVILTGEFAHLQAAEVVAADGDKMLLRVPVSILDVSPMGVKDGPESVKGTLRVSAEMLGKTRLRLECPVKPLNESGQTFSVDLASYVK
jgi:hypothetical protein